VAFLPPFDPLVWDRPLLASLFGFDYVWELFQPPAERRWGWCVLAVLGCHPLPAAPRRRVRGRTAPGTRRLSRFRRRQPPRLGTPPCRRRAALPGADRLRQRRALTGL